ncbi:vomeronasal type-2 receptor 26-like [Rhinophrynus dorsalis]
MENCVQCPKHQWSNEKRDKCIMRTLDFLSYEDPLGLALACIAIFLSSLTTAVLYIFVKYRETPIVKANNKELSYCLLLSLILSYLCSLLFIGWPMRVTCLLRQVIFGVIFTFSISSVLGKTLTVVIAFNATRPGSILRNWVGTKIPKFIVVFCSFVEVFICTLWLIHSPPFPDYDTESQTTRMILHCNEGSAGAFYIVVGYISMLAFVSFFVAYLARRLPDIFNEAQYITFSMLVFCSVWMSFIPAYLSTKGKYVTAVEIFAILASSTGLLGFIFIPKCYVILLKPELNTRSNIISLKLSQNDIKYEYT